MKDRWHPKDTSALLADIVQEFSSLKTDLEQMNADQLESPGEGGWSPKDHIAHLSEWMKSLLGYHLDRRPWHDVLGVDSDLTDNLDFDAINAILHERSRQRNYAEIIAEFRSVYAEVISRIKGMSFEELLEPRFSDDRRKRPVLNWVIANTSDHFAEHREAIEAGAQRHD